MSNCQSNAGAPSLAQMRNRMLSGHRQALEALRDNRKIDCGNAAGAIGMRKCLRTLRAWGAVSEAGEITDTGRALLEPRP